MVVIVVVIMVVAFVLVKLFLRKVGLSYVIHSTNGTLARLIAAAALAMHGAHIG